MPLPNLTLRSLTPTLGTTKGSALSFAEMDTNLNNLATANITLTAGGVTSNLGFNNTLTIHAGNGTEVVNTNGNVSISATYSNVQVASYLVANPPAGTYSNVQLATYLVANPPAGTYSNVQVASYLAGNITVGNIAGKTSGFTLGYLEMPQVAGGNVTLALADSGKHVYRSTTAPQTITIPSFANVAFGNGTVVSVVNHAVGNVALALQSGVNLYLGGNATSAARTVTTYGVATLIKVNTNDWAVNGSGVV